MFGSSCATLLNLCFVSLESQPCQSALISKNPDQQPLKQTGGPPASGGQRCVSEQLFWLLNIRVYSWLYVCDDCSCAAVETEWDDPLSETLEKEVEDARKMVSALQVHAD